MLERVSRLDTIYRQKLSARWRFIMYFMSCFNSYQYVDSIWKKRKSKLIFPWKRLQLISRVAIWWYLKIFHPIRRQYFTIFHIPPIHTSDSLNCYRLYQRSYEMHNIGDLFLHHTKAERETLVIFHYEFLSNCDWK